MTSAWKFVGSALLVAVVIAVAWLYYPRTIDVQIGELQTSYHANAGRHAVTLTLTRSQAGDHGPAELRIKTSAEEIVVSTSYNHDTLQDEPAGTWHLGWADGDVWPDVIIETNPRVPATFVVRSSDGAIQEMSVR